MSNSENPKFIIDDLGDIALIIIFACGLAAAVFCLLIVTGSG